jgi:hypothetical protein
MSSDLGHDESGPMERLERSDWVDSLAGVLRAAALVGAGLFVVFCGYVASHPEVWPW